MLKQQNVNQHLLFHCKSLLSLLLLLLFFINNHLCSHEVRNSHPRGKERRNLLIVFKAWARLNGPECHVELYLPWLPKSRGAMVARVQRLGEVQSFITAGESNFLSIDFKWSRALRGIDALLLSHSKQSGNTGKEKNKWIFNLFYRLMSLNCCDDG